MKIKTVYETTVTSYEVVYEVCKVTGFGLYEAPYVYYSTGLIYKDEGDAKTAADKLLFENTTEAERKESWRPLHYTVEERRLL